MILRFSKTVAQPQNANQKTSKTSNFYDNSSYYPLSNGIWSFWLVLGDYASKALQYYSMTGSKN